MISSSERQISPVVISTALGHDGRGIFPYTLLPGYRRLLAAVRDTGTAVFTKSATRFNRRGNFIPANPLTWKYIRRLPDRGMLNAYGLTNAGVEARAPDIRWPATGFKHPQYLSRIHQGHGHRHPGDPGGGGDYQRSLGPAFQALELNYSCPNSEEAIAKT
jgi:dihydroorotate dehydrogenase (NAD+) catalytic subunit